MKFESLSVFNIIWCDSLEVRSPDSQSRGTGFNIGSHLETAIEPSQFNIGSHLEAAVEPSQPSSGSAN